MTQIDSYLQSCAEKSDCFVKHQPGVAGCGWLHAVGQKLSLNLAPFEMISFARPCRPFQYLMRKAEWRNEDERMNSTAFQSWESQLLLSHTCRDSCFICSFRKCQQCLWIYYSFLEDCMQQATSVIIRLVPLGLRESGCKLALSPPTVGWKTHICSLIQANLESQIPSLIIKQR